MSLEVRVSFDGEGKLKKLTEKIGQILLEETHKQTLYFISDIQKTQMTGRRGSIYLNRKTGTLVRSWFPETKFVDGGILTRAFTSVKYAAIHQYGGVIHQHPRTAILSFRQGRAGFVKPSDLQRKGGSFKAGARQAKVQIGERIIHIPKRIFVVEEFEKQMPQRYKNAFQKAIIRALHE